MIHFGRSLGHCGPKRKKVVGLGLARHDGETNSKIARICDRDLAPLN
jgi:hypothetical protein